MTSRELTGSLRETLAVFETADGVGTPMTTNEVAAHHDISRRSTYERLERLVEQGFLETKKVGASGRIWWRPATVDPNETRVEPERATVRVQRREARQTPEIPQQLDDIFERIDDAFFARDEEWQFTYVTDHAAELVQLPAEDLFGTQIWDAFPDVAEGRPREMAERAMSTQESVEFEFYSETLSIWIEARVYPSENGVSVYFRDITERKERERELIQQREQLEALNNLNVVVREIIDAVIEQSTREQIEQTVCARLAETDSYEFAWTGTVDANSKAVTLQAEAGVEGYLDGVTISVDPNDERSKGPTGRALRTGEIQVSQDVQTDPSHDPWRDHVEQYSVRSSAAIPIVHEDSVYGALNVYADRPNAFKSQERTVIAQLGEVVGHAISAVERKRALMSDEVVEMTFRISDVFDVLDAPTEMEGQITLDQAVATGDGEFLVYGTATPDAVDTLHVLVDTLSECEGVTVHSEGDPVSFELGLSDPPVLSTVASLGGYIDNAAFADGDFQLTVHLASTVETRRIIDVVEESLPGAEMVRRRQVSRSNHDPQRHLASDLTDRQQTALKAAYHAGFFEWPRDASGEEVAESLDVSAPTLHQHLRKAQKKVLDSLVAATEELEDEPRT
jgi:PAS domain S-box-containing protein